MITNDEAAAMIAFIEAMKYTQPVSYTGTIDVYYYVADEDENS